MPRKLAHAVPRGRTPPTQNARNVQQHNNTARYCAHVWKTVDPARGARRAATRKRTKRATALERNAMSKT
eukprot:3232059-Lingulodinium_polyedra.AAC.1